MKTSSGKLDTRLYCLICNKNFENEIILKSHIKNGSHRHTKELNDLKNYIKVLEERIKELEAMVDEGIDALFVYEMKLNKISSSIPK